MVCQVEEEVVDQETLSDLKMPHFLVLMMTDNKMIVFKWVKQVSLVARMISSDCAKCAMIDMEYGHVILFGTWTFISDEMWQCSSNCVFVALVMITVVISVFEVEYMILVDVRKHIAHGYTAWVTGSLKSKLATTQRNHKLPINKQSAVAISNSCHHQPWNGSI